MLTVRRATSDDLDDLAPLFDAYRRFYRKPADIVASRAFLESRMRAGESLVLVARDGQDAVGFTQIYPLFSSTRMASLWLLNDLFVDAAARGRGVGAALLAEAERLARDSGVCELRLETEVDNPARRLYERSGYRHVTEYAFYSLALDGSQPT